VWRSNQVGDDARGRIACRGDNNNSSVLTAEALQEQGTVIDGGFPEQSKAAGPWAGA
jgi:hypothetical protein